jgi:hypothetical protein
MVKENMDGVDILLLLVFEIPGFPFKHMRLVGANHVNVPRLERLGVIAGYKGALSPDDKRYLRFLVTVQVVIKIGKNVFLYDYRSLLRNRNGKLNDFH